jgi:hypothetical protein
MTMPNYVHKNGKDSSQQYGMSVCSSFSFVLHAVLVLGQPTQDTFSLTSGTHFFVDFDFGQCWNF